jgi:hypothetical protein
VERVNYDGKAGLAFDSPTSAIIIIAQATCAVNSLNFEYTDMRTNLALLVIRMIRLVSVVTVAQGLKTTCCSLALARPL